jgi:hypothetical protein
MDSAFPRSRVLSALGWICLVVGLSSPLRIGLVVYDADLNVYCRATVITCIYDAVLSSLSAGAGWGLIRRRRWAPLVAGVAGGATLALAADSMFAIMYNHWASRDPQGLPEFYAGAWPFLLINSTLFLGWLMTLIAVFRGSFRKEFSATPSRPAVLLSATLLSSGLCLGITWYTWTHFVR